MACRFMSLMGGLIFVMGEKKERPSTELKSRERSAKEGNNTNAKLKTVN